MILAAGRGARLRPLTDRTPKPLLEVGGETLLGRHLHALARSGVARVVINTAWLGMKIRRFVGDGDRFGLEVRYSDEGSQALETGGGIFAALPLLGQAPFLLCNGDVWSDFDLAALSLRDGDLASLVLVDNPPGHRDGDFVLDRGRIVSARPGPAGARRYTYSGLAVLNPALFRHCEPGIFPLAPLLVEAIAAGRVAGQYHAGAWFDTGTPESLSAARDYATNSG